MPKLLVIDTETGGLDPSCASILSVAGVVWSDGSLTGSISLLITEPEMLLDPKAIDVNQIDVHQLVANKATRQVKDLRTELVDDSAYRTRLVKDLRRRNVAPAVETMLWHYAYGVPKQPVAAENKPVPIFVISSLPELTPYPTLDRGTTNERPGDS